MDSYERSNGGPGGIGAMAPMAGLESDCGCGCLGLGAVAPTTRTAGTMTGYRTTSFSPCYWAQKAEAVAELNKATLCAPPSPVPGTGMALTAEQYAACLQARQAFAAAQAKRIQICAAGVIPASAIDLSGLGTEPVIDPNIPIAVTTGTPEEMYAQEVARLRRNRIFIGVGALFAVIGGAAMLRWMLKAPSA